MIDSIEIKTNTSYETGQLYGKAIRCQVSAIKKVVRSLIKREDMEEEDLKRNAFALWNEAVSAFPSLSYEFRGICDGAKFEQEICLLYQMLPYLLQINRLHSDSCTAAVLKSPKKESDLVVFKNKDYLYEFRDLQQVVLYREKGSLNHIAFGNAGWLGCDQGMNSEGFISMLTWCDTKDRGIGIQSHILNRQLLKKARNVEEAVTILKAIKRTGGCNFLFADAEGNAAVFENGNRQFSIRFLKDSNFLVATNHFVSESMIPVTPSVSKLYPDSKFVSTHMRYNRMVEFLQTLNGAFEDEDAIRVLQDHKFGEHYYSICCHGETIGTIASFVGFPVKREVLINRGFSCKKKPFLRLTL